MNKHYIILDLDDTLYYEIDFLISAYRAISMQLDPQDAERLFNKMMTSYENKEDVFAWLALEYNVSKNELLNQYRIHYPDIKLRSGVEDFLKIKENYDCKLGLITDGRSLTQRNKIKALGIEDYFDKIIISEEIGTEKPHENNFKAFLEPGYDYTYIADNPNKDFVTPNKLSWDTIMITDEDGKKIHPVNNGLKDIFFAKKETSWDYISHIFVKE